MKRRGKASWCPYGRKKAFTLLELLLAMAIGSVLIALLSQIVFSGLNGSAAFARRVNRENDVTFALNSMVDELLEADSLYRIGDKYVQFYVREPGENGHKVVTYLLEKDTLSRFADHSHIKYPVNRLKIRQGTRTILLNHVEGLHFEKKDACLVIRLRCGDESKRIVALRGSYE